jgi:hypothetical protein
MQTENVIKKHKFKRPTHIMLDYCIQVNMLIAPLAIGTSPVPNVVQHTKRAQVTFQQNSKQGHRQIEALGKKWYES